MAKSALKMRAVIDVNVFVSGTISTTGGSTFVIDQLKQGAFQAITSRQHLREIYQVLAYPRLRRKYKITDKQRRRLVAQIYARSIFVKPRGHLAICRDPKDDYLIEMALLGRAAYLVTEDADLFDDSALVRFLRLHKVTVVRLAEFVATLHS